MNEEELRFDGKLIKPFIRATRRLIIQDDREVYPPSVKADCATLYALYGDLTEVSRTSNISLPTIIKWSKEPYWDELVKQVYRQQREKFAVRIRNVLDKTLTEIEDRLDKGDQTYNPKTGEITRKPIEARVLSSIFDSLTNHKKQIDQIIEEDESPVPIKERLKSLEEAFIRFSKKNKQEIVDAEFSELQTGL